MTTSSSVLLTMAQHHLQDATFFIGADEQDKALESIERLYNITEQLYDMLLTKEKQNV